MLGALARSVHRTFVDGAAWEEAQAACRRPRVSLPEGSWLGAYSWTCTSRVSSPHVSHTRTKRIDWKSRESLPTPEWNPL